MEYSFYAEQKYRSDGKVEARVLQPQRRKPWATRMAVKEQKTAARSM